MGEGKTITISQMLLFVNLPGKGKNKKRFSVNKYYIKDLTTFLGNWHVKQDC